MERAQGSRHPCHTAKDVTPSWSRHHRTDEETGAQPGPRSQSLCRYRRGLQILGTAPLPPAGNGSATLAWRLSRSRVRPSQPSSFLPSPRPPPPAGPSLTGNRGSPGRFSLLPQTPPRSAETRIRALQPHRVQTLRNWPQKRKGPGACSLPGRGGQPEVLISSFWNIQVPK